MTLIEVVYNKVCSCVKQTRLGHVLARDLQLPAFPCNEGLFQTVYTELIYLQHKPKSANEELYKDFALHFGIPENILHDQGKV